MTEFKPAERLEVFRRLSTGHRVRVGELAQGKRALFFQYDAGYLRRHPSLSPFLLPFDGALHQAPKTPHNGLHGLFADSLPDGWGMLLMDRIFRQHGVLPNQLAALDRLAYVSDRGLGALEYAPASPCAPEAEAGVELAALGERAQALFDGSAEEVPAALASVGSSGGARPKALVYLPADGSSVGLPYRATVSADGPLVCLPEDGPGGGSVRPGPGLTPWLVKFTSATLPLGHEESLCEAAYLAMAEAAGIEVPAWRLIPLSRSSPAIAWLALRRFDCSAEGGRYHLHSLCGLLDADFRTPCMDYEDLIKASQTLCRSPEAGRTQFQRAAFNLFALNQDDHTKNWSFLQTDQGQWRPAPFYDVTFSPNPQGGHSTAFHGHGAQPPLSAMQRLANQANFPNWARAREAIARIVDAISGWHQVAADLGVRRETRKLVGKQLDETYAANKGLMAS